MWRRVAAAVLAAGHLSEAEDRIAELQEGGGVNGIQYRWRYWSAWVKELRWAMRHRRAKRGFERAVRGKIVREECGLYVHCNTNYGEMVRGARQIVRREEEHRRHAARYGC